MKLGNRKTEMIVRIALGFFGAVLPGVFLGATLIYAFEGLSDSPGLLGLPGVAPALAALEALVGAVLLANWRSQHTLRGALFFPVIVMAGLSLYPEPLVALVVGGILLGGYLAALPVRTEGLRIIFGFSIAISFFVFADRFYWAMCARTMLFPLVLAGAVLWSNARWFFRVAFIAVLVISSAMFARGSLQELLAEEQPADDNTRLALPALLLPETRTERIFLLSSQPVPLLQVWGALPFVRAIDVYWPYRDFPPEEGAVTLSFKSGSPRDVIMKLQDGYKLLYLDLLPQGESVRRGFLDKLWRHVDSDGGILILPAFGRFALPDRAHWIYLPGSDEALVAASPKAFSGDTGELDRKLQEWQAEVLDGDKLIPGGIVSALYSSTGGSREMISERPFRFKGPVSHFCTALAVILIGYWIIRIYFERQGRNGYGFTLFENSVSLALLLFAAYDAMLYRQFFTGVPGSMVWGCAALAVCALPLREKAERLFAWLALLLPGIWLLPGIFFFEPSWLLVTAFVALIAGTIRGRTIRAAEFPRSWSLAFCSSGWIVAGGLYALLTLLLPDPLIAVLLVAAALRLPWLLKV